MGLSMPGSTTVPNKKKNKKKNQEAGDGEGEPQEVLWLKCNRLFLCPGDPTDPIGEGSDAHDEASEHVQRLQDMSGPAMHSRIAVIRP